MSYGVSRSIVNLRSRPSPTSIGSQRSHVRSGGASLSPVVIRTALETDAAHFPYPVITTSEWRSSFAESEVTFTCRVCYAPHNRASLLSRQLLF
jgi:hypothetical protein